MENRRLKQVFTINKKRMVYCVLILALLSECFVFLYYEAHISQVINQDFAKNIRHAIEFARNHTLLLRGWNYGTGSAASTQASSAALFYLLHFDIYTAYFLANLLSILVYIYIICTVCRNIQLDIQWCFMWLLLTFAPYGVGVFSWANMLFFDYGAYTYLVLLPLLIIALATTPAIKSLQFILLLTIYTILLFLGTFGAGVYVPITVLVPVVICTVSCCVRYDKQKVCPRFAVIGFITIVVSAVGIALNISLGVHAATYGLSSPADLNWLISSMADFVILFYSPDHTSVFSMEGIRQLINLSLLCGIIAFGIPSIRETGGIKKLTVFRMRIGRENMLKKLWLRYLC